MAILAPRLTAPAPNTRTAGRTIFLCIPSGTPAANLLRTRVFPILRDEPAIGRIVILSPYAHESPFVDEFGGPKVAFHGLDPGEPEWLERRFIRVMQERFVKRMPTESMRIRVARAGLLERESMSTRREIRYLDRGQLAPPLLGPKRVVLGTLARLPLPIETWFSLSDRFTLGGRYAELFQRENPDLVVTPTTGLYFSEGPLLARARRAGVAAVAIDLSWDHFTTKTAPLRPVAALSVWNETMRKQAVDIHGYRAEQVFVAGVPQFDIYHDGSALSGRAEFFRDLGADPARRLITLTTVPPVLYGFHDRVANLILDCVQRGTFGPAQLLIRVHPRDGLSAYRRFESCAGVIVEKPFRTGRLAEGSAVDPSANDRRHLANTLIHSDVIVNVASTIAIEAAICDTPVVNIAFDGPERRPFLDSAARYYHYTHYRPLVDAGAVRVARSPEELASWIGRYIESPDLDRDGRKRAVETQCYKVDGRASERVAAFVVHTLARAHPKS